MTSNQFGNSSNDLCKTFDEVTKKLCATGDLSSSLEALLACRLIPLDKNPGHRPIGMGEVLRRIASKVVASPIREDIVSAVGSLQVCAGQEAGCKSLVHAMDEIAVLLVDASNAFNTINRNAFLHNITTICPPLARYVRNFHYANTRLFIIGGGEI